MGQRDGRGLVSKKKMQVRVTHLMESKEESFDVRLNRTEMERSK